MFLTYQARTVYWTLMIVAILHFLAVWKLRGFGKGLILLLIESLLAWFEGYVVECMILGGCTTYATVVMSVVLVGALFALIGTMFMKRIIKRSKRMLGMKYRYGRGRRGRRSHRVRRRRRFSRRH